MLKTFQNNTFLFSFLIKMIKPTKVVTFCLDIQQFVKSMVTMGEFQKLWWIRLYYTVYHNNSSTMAALLVRTLKYPFVLSVSVVAINMKVQWDIKQKLRFNRQNLSMCVRWRLFALNRINICWVLLPDVKIFMISFQ